jgi:hypothetical protein
VRASQAMNENAFAFRQCTVDEHEQRLYETCDATVLDVYLPARNVELEVLQRFFVKVLDFGKAAGAIDDARDVAESHNRQRRGRILIADINSATCENRKVNQ